MRGLNMKRNKLTAILYFVCAILWATSAVINALSSKIPMYAIYIGLSATFLCLGILYRRRSKDDSDNPADK